MTIQNGRLQSAKWIGQTPNNSGRFSKPPFGIVMHYTAAAGTKGPLDWLMGGKGANKNSSAHFVVGREGDAYQLSDINLKTWHAGKSFWRGLSGMNSYMIGIEICNLGWAYKGPKPFMGVHKNGNPNGSPNPIAWEPYPEAQLKAVDAIVEELLAGIPSIKEIVGHEDISPGRKQDPGPAFPMARYQDILHGGARGEADPGQMIVAVDALNVRQSGNPTAPLISWSPLHRGAHVTVLQDIGDWSLIQTDDGRNGWVADRYLQHA